MEAIEKTLYLLGYIELFIILSYVVKFVIWLFSNETPKPKVEIEIEILNAIHKN